MNGDTDALLAELAAAVREATGGTAVKSSETPVSSAAKPIGPAPTMASVAPGSTLPLRTPHSNPVGRMSLSMTRASSSAPSGIG